MIIAGVYKQVTNEGADNLIGLKYLKRMLKSTATFPDR
jgi:hypothetical protein